MSCATCHLGGQISGGLDLSKYENIVNRPSTKRSDLMLILPGDPDNSYLFIKVTGAPGIMGQKMPLGGSLSTGQLNLLRDWILAGASEQTQ
ncbi:c-type cytochrome domain-containing protein [Candidatus Latescibacterota bacterium]